MSSLRVYGFCSVVTASIAVLLAMSTDFFVAYIHEIITPCQHDSEYRDGECVCDNTGGVFSGLYCDKCECKHFGICGIVQNSTSRWGCRCPSHQKWTGTLCDKCYATQQTNEDCLGECVKVEGVYKHFGPKCDTLCMPDAGSSASRCIQVRAGGGTCNACNGHGTCSSTGFCECDEGYFTSRDGEQCLLTCADAGITCPKDQGKCQSIGGQLQCVCEPGWYGRQCDQSCLEPNGNHLPCSGHGTCGYNAKEELTCTCSTHWIGDYCEQRCPGDVSYPSSCSGHGQCITDGQEATCNCQKGWLGNGCSCSAQYTCSGHGTCNDDGSCQCFDYTDGAIEVHFDGKACERCKHHWFGESCDLFCDEAMVYTPNINTIGQHIGCNGHGACQLETESNNEQVTCVCDGTNPDTFCATCNPNYFPQLHITNVSVPHCSVACEAGTCSNRGICNQEYDGYNDLCKCNTVTLPGSNIVLDTLDPKQNCATCKPNWFPSLMSSPDRCTKYCSADGRLESGNRIVFDVSPTDRNYDLMGDKEAQKICVQDTNSSEYRPDADCSVCSSQGTCYADGKCKCSEGTTGEFCNIQCTGPNGRKCSDHGRCVRNDLELWFNPDTESFRCECTPYDPYTSETRQRLIKQNFKVPSPPAPHYYGQYCEFHCPRYNEKICADRGECTTQIAVDELGFKRDCHQDLDCHDIDGAFCARRSSPWDSLMNDGKSFFSSGPESPGYYTCSKSEQCLDDIYSIKWDEFCVNMLRGWYPASLNTPKCTYAQDGNCRQAVEAFFMNEFEEGQTWCQKATSVLVPPMSIQDTCGKLSYADENEFKNERVPICHEYTLTTTCNAQTRCIYDQSLQYIQHVDSTCADMTPPCTGFCQDTGSQTCEPKTYCRAKTCPDIMLEQSVETLCVIEPPCDSNANWANICADASGQIRNVSSMSTSDTFYTCHMYKNRINPQHMEQTIPGGIQLNGMLRIYGQDISVESLRSSTMASIIPAGPTCDTIDFSQTEFCSKHLEYRTPSWYTPYTPTSQWFKNWLVACPEGVDSLWVTEAEATARIQQVSLDCIAYHRSSGVNGDAWLITTDEKDTIAFTNQKEYTLSCPGRSDIHLDDIQYVYDGYSPMGASCRVGHTWTDCANVDDSDAWSPWPVMAQGCTLTSNEWMQRWGQTGWTPQKVQDVFTQSCKNGLDAPWVPIALPLPTLCDLGACHPDDECILCSDPRASCDTAAAVQCKAPFAFIFRDENRCGRGGHAWQRFMTPSRIYYCDWHAYENVSLVVNSQPFQGTLTARGVLTIPNAATVMTYPTEIILNNVTKNTSSFRTFDDSVSMQWSTQTDLGPTAAESYLSTLEQCHSDLNWYEYCDQYALGSSLDTFASLGLENGWSGDAQLQSPYQLSLKNIYHSHPIGTLVVATQDRIKIQCGQDVTEGTGILSIHAQNQSCMIRSIYDRARVTSIRLNDTEQILPFDIAQQTHSTRTFVKIDSSRNQSGLSDWYFHPNGVIEKRSFIYDNTAVQFDLRGQHDHMRLSGWVYLPDDDGEIMSVRLTNEENNDIAYIYVFSKTLYLKTGTLTEYHGKRIASVPTGTWWHWQIEAEHLPHKEIRYQAENHTRFDNNETYFGQEWNITVRLDVPESIVWSAVTHLETGVKLQRHYQKSAAAYDVRRLGSKHACGQACQSELKCRQWSWSHKDQHCYLHAKACHDDPGCVHGSHVLHAIRSHRLSHFEMFANEPKTTVAKGTRWHHLRAEPVIESPPCDLIQLDQIHERWRQPFASQYTPFEPDATTICNTFAAEWTLMPGYKTKVCYGQDCEYKPNDITSCAQHVANLVPDAPDNCDKNKFLKTNWTAYCHYISSFDEIGGRIPFLGGAMANITDMCQTSWQVYDNAKAECNHVPIDWFQQCFDRTLVYEDYCSAECLANIENMLASTNESIGICEWRDRLLDVQDDIAPAPCECTMDKNMIITDFCTMQTAYHHEGSILIPELYHSECSSTDGCTDTLRDSMNRSEWLVWCSDVSSGRVKGVCSKTACECDKEEYIGVAGERCELSCPSGVSEGKEVACSGANGRCFAIDPSERLDDSIKQKASTETRISTNFSGPLVPIWLQGPSPSMEGRCQCALGSGAACSIPCEGCNNGTYGYDMASQYGICDSFNGICRSLPPFMRYNTKMDNPDIKLSFNTTAFQSGLGTYRWQFPERFLFESDETLLTQAIKYVSEGIRTNDIPILPNLVTRDNIDTMLRVFNDLCWMPPANGFTYLDNDKDVTFVGISLSLETPSIVLKHTDPPAWGPCTEIPVHDNMHFCFYEGSLYGYENGPLLIRTTGDDLIATGKMTFALRDNLTMYAFGGVREYEKTSQTLNHLYKLNLERRTWSPYDIVFVNVEGLHPQGDTPPASVYAPMYSFYDKLYLVTSNSDEHTLYILTYATLSIEARWLKQTTWTHASSVVNVLGDRTSKDFYVYFEDDAVYALANGTMHLANITMERPPSVSALRQGWAPTQGLQVPCTLTITNSTLNIGGQVIAEYGQSPAIVKVYLEEWRTIDVLSQTDINMRVHNAIEWNRQSTTNMPSLTKDQYVSAFQAVTRTHMHQSRWSLHSDMLMRYRLSQSMVSPVVEYVNMTSGPSDKFLQFFSSLSATFMEDTPTSVPGELSLAWEGDEHRRCLVIHGVRNEKLAKYSQTIDFEKDEIVIYVDWSVSAMRLSVVQKHGLEQVSWRLNRTIGSFTIVMHIEEWLVDPIEPFQPKVAVGQGTDALIQLFVTLEKTATYNMMHQTNSFVEYTPSHCSLTADSDCPGILPHIALPCSGRGKCSISCQCTCDVAGSVLAATTGPLGNVEWSDSPYRGAGCEIVCPGYDGFDKASICNARGVCQRDGTCTCSQGYTGDACQFECPVNENNETCSLHGGCGTTVVDLDSFSFSGDSYLDTLAGKNRVHYKQALKQFYNSCSDKNFIQEKGTFGAHTRVNASLDTLALAQQTCLETNNAIQINEATRRGRIYPEGRCIGLARLEDDRIGTVILDAIETEQIALDNDMFKCDRSECTLTLTQNDVLSGIQITMASPVFEIHAQYVHGSSVGVQHYVVNGEPWRLESNWTQDYCEIRFGPNAQRIVSVQKSVSYVHVLITQQTAHVDIYPVTLPSEPTTQTIWLAPEYGKKYMLMSSITPGYYYNGPSGDTGTIRVLTERHAAELECDSYAECEGIIRWDSIQADTLYSLFTFETYIDKHTLVPVNMSDNNFDFYVKTSHIYQGRTSVEDTCQRVRPGQSKYPSVQYTEEYNIPIEQVNLDLIRDDSTDAVFIGDGIWKNCWTHKPGIHTKKECYDEAKKTNFGFAFSDETLTCFVYTGIKDPNKIKLNEFSDETHLSLNHPCSEDSTWIPI